MSIDWKKIKKNYPKAFNVLVKDHETIEEWGEIDNPKIWGVHVEEPHWVIRHLYDFFDSKGLFISPDQIIIRGNDKIIWYFTIGQPTNLSFYVETEETFNNRTEAEIAAFTKAFLFLEIMLNDDKPSTIEEPKIQFGLEQQGHIPHIEKRLKQLGGFHYHAWVGIAKEINWEPLTAACYYYKYLEEKQAKYKFQELVMTLGEFADKVDDFYRPYTTNNCLAIEYVSEFVQTLNKE